MKFLLSILILGLSSLGFAQNSTWSGAISNIIHSNCSSCHHDGGIAPFELMTYEDVTSFSEEIEHVVTEREMPPWPADPNYMHFANEAYLDDAEIEALQWWVQNDMPIGDENDIPPLPVFPDEGSLLETIDFTLEIDPYTLQSNSDQFRWFVFENPYEQDIFISKLEVIPGLEDVVHHADLFYDLTGASLDLDNQDPLSGFGGETGYPVNSFYINAWQPGGNIAEYPDNWGIRVPPNADLVIEIHYGPGGMGQIDETKMNLQFLVDPINPREVNASWLMGHNEPTLIDGPLFIPANEEAVFHQVTAPLENDLSVISICPHMHFIGKSYRVWYTDPYGEDHPLIYIPRWDLHWQKYYVFQTIKHIPAGSILKSQGVYDNTSANHDNPFDPPQDVSLGLGTYDEMFLCYFIYANYEEGDENIIMDENYTHVTNLKDTDIQPNIFPNPAADFITVQLEDELTSWRIFSLDGKEILYGDGTGILTTIDVSSISEKGIYSILLESKTETRVSRFVLE